MGSLFEFLNELIDFSSFDVELDGNRLGEFLPQFDPRGCLLVYQDVRGYELAQAFRAVELGGLDIMETSRKDLCSNNRLGYGVRGAVARPSRAIGAQDDVGLGL